MENMSREKRQFERYPCAILGSYVGNTDIARGIKCHNLGTNGAGLTVSESLPKGTFLNLDLCTKKGNPLSTKGVIRWCKKTPDEWQAGIEFSKPALFPLAMVI